MTLPIVWKLVFEALILVFLPFPSWFSEARVGIKLSANNTRKLSKVASQRHKVILIKQKFQSPNLKHRLHGQAVSTISQTAIHYICQLTALKSSKRPRGPNSWLKLAEVKSYRQLGVQLLASTWHWRQPFIILFIFNAVVVMTGKFCCNDQKQLGLYRNWLKRPLDEPQCLAICYTNFKKDSLFMFHVFIPWLL